MGFKIEGNKVIIEFDPESTEESRSGKTIMLGTSNGFQWIKTKNGEIGISYNIVKRKK